MITRGAHVVGASAITEAQEYFVPPPARWPIVGALAFLLMAFGAVGWINGAGTGPYVLIAGVVILARVMVGWFSDVIGEGRHGLYDDQVERSFRTGMAWFIGSEVVVFGVLFAALFYFRIISIPGLASGETHALLWPEFKAGWPSVGPGIDMPLTAMQASGVPTINTLILLTSGIMITLAHHALNRGRRRLLAAFVLATIVLGMVFLKNQAVEYHHAYTALHVTLATGVYGATFFVLTGLHGVHVAIGTAFLIVMLERIIRGDFSAKHHLGFLAATWYWHFVGVVWLILFVLVYWL